MKKIIYLTLIVLNVILLQTVLYGETTRKYDYKDFTSVSVGYGMHVKIIQSDNYSISIKANENDFKYIEVEKSGDELKIYISKHNYRMRDDVYINISMPELTELGLSGGSEGELAMKISSKSFNADLSGGSTLKGNLSCGNASLGLSGGSVTNINGNCKDLKIDGSGGSIFKLKNFTSANVDADLSGGSEATINTNGVLNTSQSGGSHVTFYGNPRMGNTSFSGGSFAEHGD